MQTWGVASHADIALATPLYVRLSSSGATARTSMHSPAPKSAPAVAASAWVKKLPRPIPIKSKTSQNLTGFPWNTALGSTRVRFRSRARRAATRRASRCCDGLASSGTRYHSCRCGLRVHALPVTCVVVVRTL
eukprot:scaffold26650_cov63-Phaeocystis_antarctica.AAC.7